MIHISSHFMPFRSFQWSFLIFSSVLYTKWDSFFTFFSLFSLLSSFLHSFLPSLPPFHLSFFLSFFFPFLSFTETYVIFIGSPIANSIQVKTATKRKLCSNMNIFFLHSELFVLLAFCEHSGRDSVFISIRSVTDCQTTMWFQGSGDQSKWVFPF